MRALLRLFSIAVALSFPASALSAPAPVNRNFPGPAVSAQAKSIDDLISTVRSTAKNFLPKAIYDEFEKEAIGQFDPKMLPGIDTKRPFGFYAVLGEGLPQMNLEKTSVVAVIPVLGEKEVLGALDGFGIKPEKKGDVYTIALPNMPFPVSLRFVNQYAYVGISGNNLDLKMLPDPSDVIDAGEKSAAMLRVRFDRLPGDLKQVAVQVVKDAFAEARRQQQPDNVKDFVETAVSTMERWILATIEEGRELSIRLNLDPVTGNFSTELSLDALPNTPLAKSLASFAKTKNTFADLIGQDGAASVQFALPLIAEDLKMLTGKVVELARRGAEDGVGQAPAEVVAFFRQMMDSVAASVKNGQMDEVVALRGPDKEGRYTAVAALTLKDAAKVDQALQAAAKAAANDPGFQMIKFGALQVGGKAVHKVAVADAVPPPAQKVFGKSDVYFSFHGDAVFAAFGGGAEEAMKEMLGRKFEPKPAPVLQMSVSGKRLMPLLKAAGVPVDGEAAPFFEKFKDMDRVDVATLKVEGGEKLTIRAEFNILPVIGLMPRAVGTEAPAAPAPAPKLQKP